jgi:exopolyphosphatase/guanosine-5'-triphosphate,3'-diphosphate pyrophosphatase
VVYVKPWSRATRPHEGADPRFRQVLAALDLGTNNCRLLVARPVVGSFHVVDAFSRIVRLGERVRETGELGVEPMARTIDALRVCKAKLDRRGVTRYRGVATEACRRARNASAFIDHVRREVGIDVEIIEPAEEARLAVAGCAALLELDRPHAIMFDIGGGSTEVIWIAPSDLGGWHVIDSLSLACGVVHFAERFGGDTIPAEGYEAMIEEVRALLVGFDARHGIRAFVDAGRAQMLGTSGTVTTLAGIRQNLPRYDRAMVDGSWLELVDVLRISRELAGLDWAGRAAQPCVGPERADLVVAGCAILEAICRLWPVPRLRVADRGLREGIILGLMDGANGTTGGARASPNGR